MSHAETQAARLETRAKNEINPRKKARFLRLAVDWRKRAVETEEDRDARIERDMLELEARRKKLADSKAETERRHALRRSLREALRYAGETPDQRAARRAAELARSNALKAARAELHRKAGTVTKARDQARRAKAQRAAAADFLRQLRAERRCRKQSAPAPLPPPLPDALPPLPY